MCMCVCVCACVRACMCASNTPMKTGPVETLTVSILRAGGDGVETMFDDKCVYVNPFTAMVSLENDPQ